MPRKNPIAKAIGELRSLADKVFATLETIVVESGVGSGSGSLAKKKPGRPAKKKPGRPPKKRGRPAKKKPGRPAKKKPGRPAKKKPGRPPKKRGRPAKKKPGRPIKKKPGRPAKKKPGRPAKKKSAPPAKKKPGRPAKKKPGRPAKKKSAPPAKKAAKKKKPARPRTASIRKPSVDVSTLDYNMDAAAFAEKYVYKVSGPRKFLLMLAYHAKGQANRNVPILSVRSDWKKLNGKNQLGDFNGLYPNKAKRMGGAVSPKRGFYALADGWATCF